MHDPTSQSNEDHPIIGRRLRAVVVEDEVMFRQMVGMAIARLPRYELVGEAANAAEASNLLINADPDVAVLDLGLPDESGIDLARRALGDAPNLRILAITARRDGTAVRAALDVGILGFVSKGESYDILLTALNQVASGLPFYSPSALTLLREGLTQSSDQLQLLTPRERDVVCESARGFSVKEISHRLGISENTVKTHRKNVLQKLDLHDVVALTHFALRHGLVTL
ncbi:LuxR C-terminal-related transcriptional regulator [Synoicihabitans lomoniglobus]|uniref:Response regulator transcription factor n=1 Tax=Synoicihabitans lomoniglobus TaxID=2909285 RepID=A0AAF0CRF4_9BACT|nr:response regulator transcription factor [Opitutaceae bacterium LMO-M01]WED66664.1 response regulator transcription factor [Opitutaceae bacterium LMO-M01]